MLTVGAIIQSVAFVHLLHQLSDYCFLMAKQSPSGSSTPAANQQVTRAKSLDGGNCLDNGSNATASDTDLRLC